MKKFITFNEKFEVQLIHNMPFDKVHGLGKNEEELLQLGALVDEIPLTDNIQNNKTVIYKYNKEDNTVYYELIDRDLTEEEKTAKRIKELEKENEKMKKDMIATQNALNDLIFNVSKGDK